MVIRPPRVCYQWKHFISRIMKTFARRFHTQVCVYMCLVNETHCDIYMWLNIYLSLHRPVFWWGLRVWSHWVNSHTSPLCAYTGTCSPTSGSSWSRAGYCQPMYHTCGCFPALCERRTENQTERNYIIYPQGHSA